MTEVDAVMLEGVPIANNGIQVNASSSSTSTTPSSTAAATTTTTTEAAPTATANNIATTTASNKENPESNDTAVTSEANGNHATSNHTGDSNNLSETNSKELTHSNLKISNALPTSSSLEAQKASPTERMEVDGEEEQSSDHHINNSESSKANDDALVTSTSTENINSLETKDQIEASEKFDGEDSKVTSVKTDAGTKNKAAEGADENEDTVAAEAEAKAEATTKDVTVKSAKNDETSSTAVSSEPLEDGSETQKKEPPSFPATSTSSSPPTQPRRSSEGKSAASANCTDSIKSSAPAAPDSLKDSVISSTTASPVPQVATQSELIDSNENDKLITSTDTPSVQSKATVDEDVIDEKPLEGEDTSPISSDQPMDEKATLAEEDPLKTTAEDPIATKNGVASDEEKAGVMDTTVVDLDDDSDDDVVETESNHNNKSPKSPANSNNKSNLKNASTTSNDSDVAVIIGSDSETEGTSTVNKVGKDSANSSPSIEKLASSSAPQVIDDDDDDCVVIEDDMPPTQNDISKRKADNNIDDAQPPNKRLRNNIAGTQLSMSSAGIVPGPMGVTTSQIGQISIKDARSLMSATGSLTGNASTTITPTELNSRKSGDSAIYPINITPATNLMPNIGPPKLTPIGVGGNSAVMGGIMAQNLLPGLPGLNTSTANLLPGLTDDMFVLEAPSFIVPYIYEKPPSESLKEVVKSIESKYELSKEDLAEADKPDEFDMVTEQNKEDKEEKTGKKKKKRRGGEDNDDSWSEESDEDEDDEDDDDSESGMRTKILIKEAADDLTALKGAIKPASAVVQSTGSGATVPVKAGQENYFESPLGKFFMDIGVGLVQEFVQNDLIRLQKRKMRKSLGKNIGEYERAITALSANLETSKKKNSPFKFTMKRCEFCNFKSESALAMANHYETPHMNGPLYRCNFCTFEIRNATEIVYHMEAMHNIKARLIKPLPYHQCPNCGFEDNGKAKLARHQPVCAKKFRPEINLAPPNDWEAPAKIPRIKPRHGLVGTATAYQAMAAQAAAQKAALATIQQQQQQAAQARNMQAAALAAQNAKQIRGRPPIITKTTPMPIRGVTNQVRPMAATNVVLPNNYQLPGNQLMQNASAPAALAAATVAASKKQMSGQPSISITPLPRQNASPQAATTSKMTPQTSGLKPGQTPTAGNKAHFVICEICDGYIKDLEQLRNHMQWMHKVKIHPKMIYNRPPLNCQKCQFRFFTDQGLERHLLGSHGLVTSSMQEAANKGKDAGRCPVCGRMYQWKLLNHVARDHHMTLKPAHLSYKCTVCTATFGMYKQFETHVYTAHSTVAKKAMDGKKNATNAVPSSTVGGPSGSGTSSSGLSGSAGIVNAAAQRGNMMASTTIGATTNDSLLKPLKINDEITIIPQPAAKPRVTNMESHVID